MQRMLEITKTAFNEVAYFPAEFCKWFCLRQQKPSSERSLVFLTLCVGLSAVLFSYGWSLVPPIIWTPEGWVVLLDTSYDRITTNFLNTTTLTLSFVEALTMTLAGSFAMTSVVFLARRTAIWNKKFGSTLLILSCPFGMYLLFNAAMAFIPSSLASKEIHGIIIAIVVAFLMLGTCWAAVATVIYIRRTSQVGWVTGVVGFLTAILIQAVVVLCSPQDVYTNILKRSAGVAKWQGAVAEAMRSIGEGQPDQAVYLLAPVVNNTNLASLEGELTWIQALRMAGAEEVVIELERLERQYAEYPALQLFIAQQYAVLGIETAAKSCSRAVALNSEALPYERVAAAELIYALTPPSSLALARAELGSVEELRKINFNSFNTVAAAQLRFANYALMLKYLDSPRSVEYATNPWAVHKAPLFAALREAKGDSLETKESNSDKDEPQ